jgi:hypothetical protein
MSARQKAFQVATASGSSLLMSRQMLLMVAVTMDSIM